MARSGKKKTSKATKIFFALTVTCAVAVAAVIGGGIWYLHSGDDVDYTKVQTAVEPLKLYAADGTEAAYCSANYGYASSDEIPELVKNAFIAIEDKRFYSHDGIDYIRLAGAAIGNLRSGSFAEGGSTITQQLAKNIYLSSEKSVSRKIREAQIAVKLEKHYSKDQLLEYYLNMLYFGSGEYGVKNAAERFFGKELNELTPLEAAMLAGIVKAPSNYNPINDFERSSERARLVLSLMYEQGMIDEDSYNLAKTQQIIIKNELNENSFDSVYVVNALEEACGILGTDEKSIAAKGYEIYTYLDNDRQKYLRDAVLSSDSEGLSAAVSARVVDHSIDAVYANFALSLDSFARQSGSALKPLACYAPAFDAGVISPASVLGDEKTDFGGYSPSNYNDVYRGSVSAREALSLSLNVPAVHVMQSVGVSESVYALEKAGISLSDGDDNLSLALGSTENGINFKELLGGYLTLADGGSYSRPALVSAIADSEGNVVYRRNANSARAFSERAAYLTTDCLKDCAAEGTAKKLSPLGFDVAAKTGTVGDEGGNHDAYCIGYTSDTAALFWCGSDDYSSYIPENGGGIPCIRLREYLDDIYSDGAPKAFEAPDGVVNVALDKADYEEGRLTLASDNAPEYAVTTELFDSEFLPTEKNSSFDWPKADNIVVSEDDGGTTITFVADPRLSYRIIRKNFLKKDDVISEITMTAGDVTVSDSDDGFFPSTYVIIPYYLDGSGCEVYGEITAVK